MKTVAAVLICLCIVGCGGGGDAVCDDFKYQQDAQNAFRDGEDQLDADNDGIACEHLPRR